MQVTHTKRHMDLTEHNNNNNYNTKSCKEQPTLHVPPCKTFCQQIASFLQRRSAMHEELQRIHRGVPMSPGTCRKTQPPASLSEKV